MSQNPPPISIQAVLPKEEAVKLVFWQSPDEALFSQEDIAKIHQNFRLQSEVFLANIKSRRGTVRKH